MSSCAPQNHDITSAFRSYIVERKQPDTSIKVNTPVGTAYLVKLTPPKAILRHLPPARIVAAKPSGFRRRATFSDYRHFRTSCSLSMSRIQGSFGRKPGKMKSP